DGYGDANPTATGAVSGLDCDDLEPNANPGATEVTDGIDNDCDGTVDNTTTGIDADGDGYDDTEDCDDSDEFTYPGAAFNESLTDCMTDADEDGYGDGMVMGSVIPGTDCDDSNFGVYPGAGYNESDPTLCVEDADGDGYGNDTSFGMVDAGTDCDDTDAFTHPGSGYAEADPSLCMTDADQDGYGDQNPLSPTADAGTDCDDDEPSAYPNATEIADGVDNDCDGVVDNISSSGTDADGDGYDHTVDCDDADAFTHPGAAENESDPTLCMTDADEDGYGDQSPPNTAVVSGSDCDDSDATINPGMQDSIGDGIDQDCDGTDGPSGTLTIDDLNYGDFVITEIMISPSAVSSSVGQWFEFYNNAGAMVDLTGLVVRDSGSETFTVSSLIIQDNQAVVFGISDDQSVNGGVSVNYVYGTSMNFSSTASDSIILDANGVVIDQVDFSPTTHPNTPGASLSLDSNLFDTSSVLADSNDDPSNWCDAVAPYGSGDYGSPADLNEICEGSIDADGDGYDSSTDCDDADADVNPGAVENIGNGIDDNCDGQIDESSGIDVDGDGYDDNEDCDDNDANTYPGAAYYESASDCMTDEDGDGYGSDSPTASGAVAGTDCDDSQPEIHPGAAFVESMTDCMADFDGDGYGEANPPTGVTAGIDCNDSDAYTHPYVAMNEVDPSQCMIDFDGDGYGEANLPNGSPADAGTDCDDSDASAYPSATEIVDSIDNDCDGLVDNIASSGTDADGDGYDDSVDCDDTDEFTHPGAAENESDPTLCMTDADEDGYGDDNPANTDIIAGTDCDDTDSSINLDGTEIPSNAIDEDCDGSDAAPDDDNDGFDATLDCDDTDEYTYPGAAFNESSTLCMTDLDGDGYGEANPSSVLIEGGTDCDDTDEYTYPGAAYEESSTICMTDEDGDGYGSDNPSNTAVTAGTDCNDTSDTVNPGATDVNYDCDSTNDSIDTGSSGIDNDGDGFDDDVDCDDDPVTGANTYPGAGSNETTPSLCMRDDDGDGYGDMSVTGSIVAGTDCNDDSTQGGANIYPGAAELDSATDCMQDADGDGYGNEVGGVGYTKGSDCDDSNPSINPD
ncbi:MAG: MopE-related protein, partial [Myxococcota bacterium]|nr:MopE-related protein [Myxococcota bacterium]